MSTNAPTQPPKFIREAIEALGQGKFPHTNKIALVGQIYPTRYQQQGFEFKTGNGQSRGLLQINVKVRKQYIDRDGNASEPRIQTIRLIVYGQRGQQLQNQLRPGMMIGFMGEYRTNNWQDKQTGQWKSAPQVILDDDRDGPSFWILPGEMPIVDESRPPQQGNNQRGFSGGNQQRQAPAQQAPRTVAGPAVRTSAPPVAAAAPAAQAMTGAPEDDNDPPF